MMPLSREGKNMPQCDIDYGKNKTCFGILIWQVFDSDWDEFGKYKD